MLALNWYGILDGDPRGYYLYKRHYSALPYKRRPRGHKTLFCGPGQKVVLLLKDCRGLLVWRKFIDKSGQQGINCAIFRNESNILSSELILEAEEVAWQYWPGEKRLYTYVNPRKINSTNPGFCFKMAGWILVRDEKRKPLRTTKGHYILEKYRNRRSPRTKSKSGREK